MIASLIIIVIALCFVPWGYKQPPRKNKTFGDGMFTDTKDTDQAVHYGSQYIP